MGNTETSHNMLLKTKHTRSSKLSYRVGLDPVATSYGLKGPATSLARSYLTT